MSEILLLDTNAYVDFMTGRENVVEQVQNAEQVVFSVVVLGELLFGFRNGNRFDKNMVELNTFLDHPYVLVLPVSAATADRFGRIAAQLRQMGTPIPSNDIWIAAHALEIGATLLTRDKHFGRIDGLVLAGQY